MTLINQGFGGGFAPGESLEITRTTDEISVVVAREETVVTTETIVIELQTEKTNQMPVDASEQVLKTEC